jgi:hypothetical protein
MDDEMWARSIASLAGALTVLADVADPKKKNPADPLTQGLAYADAWLDNILPGRLRGDGKTYSFDLEE